MEVTFFIKSIHKFGVILNTAINLGIAVSILVARVKHHFDATAPGNVIHLLGVMLNRSQSTLTSVCLRRCGGWSGHHVREWGAWGQQQLKGWNAQVHHVCVSCARVHVCVCVCVHVYVRACVCVDVCVCVWWLSGCALSLQDDKSYDH